MAELVDYQPGHRKEILEFFPDVPFKDRIWDWEFEQCPGVADVGFSPMVMADDQGVVGFNGVMPVSIKYGTQVVDGLWSCDFHVAARVRGQGIGKTIKKNLLARAPVIMSFGVSEQASFVLEKMGWNLSPNVRSFRRIVEGVTFREQAIRVLQWATRLVVRAPSERTVKLAWQSELPGWEEVNALWEAAAPTYDKVVCRNHDYLNWRYQQHPLARYDFLIARDDSGALKSIMVFREHESIVRVVDYIGPAGNARIVKSMMLAGRSRYSRARLWLATTSDRTLKRVFLSEGLFPGRSSPGLYVYAIPELTVGEKACEKGWFVMSGDSDGELLRAARDTWEDLREGKAGASHE